MIALVQAVRDAWAGEAVPEESVADRPQTNGAAERAVRTFKEQWRTMRLALEDKIQMQLPATHALQTWLVEYVSAILRRVKVGLDGRTPYERLRGRRSHRALPVFGESIYYKPLRDAVEGEMAKFHPAIFVGVRERSDEIIVIEDGRAIRARDFKRRVVPEQWSLVRDPFGSSQPMVKQL